MPNRTHRSDHAPAFGSAGPLQVDAVEAIAVALGVEVPDLFRA
jgi:hypothetical protein